MRRLPIGRKLAVALAGPLTALIVLTVLEVANTASRVDTIMRQTELAKSSIGPAGIITALQNERTWLAVDLIGQAGTVTVPVEGVEETRAQADAALAAFRDELDGRSELVVEAFREPLDGLEERLAAVRRQVDTESGPPDLGNLRFADDVFARYTELIQPFFAATTRVSQAIDDPDLRQGAELADAVARQIETLSQLLNRTITDATLSAGGIDQPAEITRIAMLHSDFREYATRLADASGPYARLAAELYPEALTARVDERVEGALATGRIDLAALLDAVNVPADEGYIGYQQTLHEMITDRADDLQSSAEARQVWFAAGAVAALGAAVVLTWLVSRSITRPLRRLTREAKEMAERRLPNAVLDILDTPLGDDVDVPHVAPVTVRTRDEVADVAVALNTVQDSAVDLAVEQAVLRRNIADSFVNLGRRNQSLLGRQLDFITELESNETTPETLASLFRLDHLATRMRRNAESLLVLAGVEPPRKWAAPVRLTDVIRAALGEVEDYQRVVIRAVEPATVLGSVAADLAHLIAELLENALTFSPPDQTVEVRGRSGGSGPPGAAGASGASGYTLAVVDRGFGMPDEDMVQANRRLSGSESFTIAPSKYLGHYVAGNLATRHGIRIQLGLTPGHGVTATIELPPAMLTTEAPVGGPITDPHGSRTVGSRTRPTAPAEAPALPAPGAAPGPTAPSGPTGGGAVVPAASTGPAGPAGPGAAPPPPTPSDAGPLRWDRPEREQPAAAGGPAGPARTASGLAKRPSRGGGPPADRSPAPAMDGDMLAALSRHTQRLDSDRRGRAPGTPGQVRGRLPSSPAAPTTPPRGAAGSPPPPPSGVALPPPGLAPPAGPPFGPGTPPGRPGGTTPGGPWPSQPPPSPAGPTPGGPAPFGPGTTAGPSGTSAPAGTGASQAGRSVNDAVRAFLASTQARPDRAGPPRRSTPPPGPAPDPARAGTTSGGLPRRVRGAQLPTAEPLSLRRGRAAADPPRSAPPTAPATRPPDAAADDVYSFLSNFTAGLQRGLDEARPTEDPDDRPDR